MGLPHAVEDPLQVAAGGRFQDLSRRIRTLMSAEAHACIDQGRNAVEKQVIKLRARLPADLNSIFETTRSHQRDFPPITLQNRVRANSGPMQQYKCLVSGDLADGFSNSLRRIRRRRKHFEHADLSVRDPDTIREGATSIDGDAKCRLPLLHAEG